jgi:hypothetical protein
MPFTPRDAGLHLVALDGYAGKWMLRSLAYVRGPGRSGRYEAAKAWAKASP